MKLAKPVSGCLRLHALYKDISLALTFGILHCCVIIPVGQYFLLLVNPLGIVFHNTKLAFNHVNGASSPACLLQLTGELPFLLTDKTIEKGFIYVILLYFSEKWR